MLGAEDLDGSLTKGKLVSKSDVFCDILLWFLEEPE